MGSREAKFAGSPPLLVFFTNKRTHVKTCIRHPSSAREDAQYVNEQKVMIPVMPVFQVCRFVGEEHQQWRVCRTYLNTNKDESIIR